MWVEVGQVRARQSPWFGVKDSLKVVVYLLLIVAVLEFLRTAIVLWALVSQGIPDDPWLLGLTAVVVLRLLFCGWAVHISLNGLAGVRSFPRDATLVLSLSLVSYLANLGLIAAQLGAERLSQQALVIFVTLFAIVALLAYVQTSRRVNATYRYRLRDDEVSAPAAP